MKVETFLERLDEIADTTSAVAKLRELIVQLAVRGDFVPNNPEDEPVGLKMGGNSSGDSLLSNWRSGFLG